MYWAISITKDSHNHDHQFRKILQIFYWHLTLFYVRFSPILIGRVDFISNFCKLSLQFLLCFFFNKKTVLYLHLQYERLFFDVQNLWNVELQIQKLQFYIKHNKVCFSAVFIQTARLELNKQCLLINSISTQTFHNNLIRFSHIKVMSTHLHLFNTND